MHRLTILLLTVVCAFSVFSAFSQGWDVQNPRPPRYGMNDVLFTDSLTGWMVGSAGLIFHTLDGGATWQEQPSGTTDVLWAIAMADSDLGWIAGPYGYAVRTFDGGQTWRDQYTGLSGVYYDVACLGRRNIFMVGSVGSNGVISHTVNSGFDWNAYTVPNTCFRSITFVDNAKGWAVGDNGVVVHTGDGGITWAQQVSGTADMLNGVAFADSLYGWAVGGWLGGMVLHTTNGGAAWDSVTAFPSQISLGVTCAGRDTCWVYGDIYATSGRTPIMRTTNGGLNWTAWSEEGWFEVHAMRCTGSSNVWAVGLSKASYSNPYGSTPWGLVLHSQNGGNDWTVTNSLTFSDLLGVGFVNDDQGCAVGEYGTIVRTTDGGLSWTKLNSGSTANLYDLTFSDGNAGWVVGSGGTVLHTTTGGATWTPQGNIPGNPVLNGVASAGDRDCWITTEREIWHSGNGGATWAIQPSGFVNYLEGLFFLNVQTGWVGADSGRVLHTTDGGQSWNVQAVLPDGSVVGDILFVDSSNGWIAGSDSAIFRTMDGGQTWNEQFVASYSYPRRISFADVNNGLVVGGLGGSVYRTADGGQSWTSDTVTLGLTKNAVCMRRADLAWVTGQLGTISRFTGANDAPLPHPAGALPGTYSLTAYPNPFNPETRLEFTLAAAGRVQLKVYDLAGRFVRTLTDRFYPRGRYSVMFDGADLPSGSYFVRLQSGGSSAVQKLILLK